MSLKIDISYTDEVEKEKLMKLLMPILKGAKMKGNNDKKPYKKLYITL